MTEHPPDPNPGTRRVFPPSSDGRGVSGWRIYYGDDSEYDSARGPWDGAPERNVQCVKVWHDEPVPDTGELFATVYAGEEEYLLRGNDAWKIGRLISDGDFYRQYWKAFYDSRVPRAD